MLGPSRRRTVALLAFASLLALFVGCAEDSDPILGNGALGNDSGAEGAAISDASGGGNTDRTAPKDSSATDATTEDAADAGPDADADAGPDGDAGPDADGAPPFDIYDPSIVPTFELGFDAAALAILTSTDPAKDKTWVHGTFKYGNTVFADVGVRRKGSSTFRALPKKAALKVRFDRYVPGQRFLGLSDLTLNNSLSDPTFIAERLAYHVFRSAGLPAQKANSAWVTINDQPYGLYVNVETPGADLVKRLFGAKAKYLYEVESGSEWTPGSEDGFEEDVGDGETTDLLALFQAATAAQPATLLTDVAPRLDTEQWLRFSATEAIAAHYDGYGFGVWGSHNYYMAGNTDGVFSLLPWSTDLTFSDREGVVNAATPKNVTGGATLLMRCKTSAPCWAAYVEQIKSVLALWSNIDLVPLAQAWHAQVNPHVLADPKREDPNTYYESETALLYQWIAARPAVVRAQLGIPPP